MKKLVISTLAMCISLSAMAQGQALIPFGEKALQTTLEKAFGSTSEALMKEFEVTLKNSSNKTLETLLKTSTREEAVGSIKAVMHTMMKSRNMKFDTIEKVYNSSPEIFPSGKEIISQAKTGNAAKLAYELNIADGIITDSDKAIAMEVAANLKGKTSTEVKLFAETTKSLNMEPTAKVRAILLDSQNLAKHGETILGKQCGNVSSETSAGLLTTVEEGSKLLDKGARDSEVLEGALTKVVGEERAKGSACHLSVGKFGESTSGCGNTLNPRFAPLDC